MEYLHETASDVRITFSVVRYFTQTFRKMKSHYFSLSRLISTNARQLLTLLTFPNRYIVTSNCNKKTNELDNNYIQNTLDTSKKESDSKLNFLSELKEMRKSYVKNLIVGQLNINFLRNKFLSVKELLSHALDLSAMNEMKLDDSFPNAQF